MSNISLADKWSIMTQNQQIIAENQEKVYNAGYEKGKAEGSDSYYDTFWDTFQNHGQPANYQYAFGRGRFDDTNYNPKYPIVCSSSGSAGGSMFYGSNITDTKVPIDLTMTNSTGGIFNYCYYLKTIRKLMVSETTPSVNFYHCTQLKNVTVEGTIAASWDASYSPLTKDSILSIFNALSTTATGKTITFKQTAVNTAFATSTGANDGSTSTEWEALKAEHSNWTIALA